jgi:hypothetical protein
LQPQIKNTRENVDLKKDTKVALDCSYNNGGNLKFLEDKNLDGYIPTISQAQEYNNKEMNVEEDSYEYD